MPPKSSNSSYSKEEQQFLKNIGFKIQFLRKQRGISQSELAESSGLSDTTISHLESTSAYGISMIALYRIAKALDVDPSQLLTFR
ncbi:helix-turn-helix domain-containing protein [Desulfosporosinus lacus]|uniref:Helix-turn-helix n=1 Tax=Desulfosporosinus lacus DSM 15449 TaxID=1121420 RepID=A0A1M5Z515_9FIRM|nr:helix-turn-helix transcriptional regulator [Desulfosporosinus lacus]SHI19356.1 Helix-turn-helix [Desulfosporosinus lacus DSM 15449]